MQRSLTLLVRYRSRGVFSLPSRCLGYSRGISNPRYSGADARSTDLRYGVVTLYHAPFQETSRRGSCDECQSNTTLPGRLRFGLCRVHSRLLTTSRSCVLFLPILRCFSSRRSPLRAAIAVGIPIRRSRVLRLRAAPSGLSQLGTSVVGSRAEPSTSWRSSHAVVDCHCTRQTGPVDVWIARTHGVIYTPRWYGCVYRPFPLTLARSGASVCSDSLLGSAPT